MTTSVCAMEMSTSAQPAHAEPMTGRKNSPVAVNSRIARHRLEKRSRPPFANTHHSTHSATAISAPWCAEVIIQNGV